MAAPTRPLEGAGADARITLESPEADRRATLRPMPLHIPYEEMAAWLRLSQEPGLGLIGAITLLRGVGGPHAIYAMKADALARHLPPGLARQLASPPPAAMADAIERALRWVEEPDRHIITLGDPRYPAALLTTADPPLLLYVRGQLTPLAGPSLAVVGARNATAGGLENARRFAGHLAAHGWCVVSGLAQGIDAAAHEGALAAGAAGAGTVAVMGTGMDTIYPSRHAALAERIAAAGALVTELPLGSPALPHHFPRRNRLVAGLSRGVLVVEAAPQSGSLITARLAAENGREVFAIPGSIHSPLSRGCHALIRQGAKLVETARDITEEFGLAAPWGDAAAGMPAVETPPKPCREDSVLAAIGHDPVHLDTLLARTGLDSPSLNARLLELELTGAVARLDGGRFQRLAGARSAAKD